MSTLPVDLHPVPEEEGGGGEEDGLPRPLLHPPPHLPLRPVRDHQPGQTRVPLLITNETIQQKVFNLEEGEKNPTFCEHVSLCPPPKLLRTSMNKVGIVLFVKNSFAYMS